MSRNREDERQGLAVVWDGASWKKRWELFVTHIQSDTYHFLYVHARPCHLFTFVPRVEI